MLKRLSYIGYSAALATGPALLTACSSTTAEQAADPSVLFSLTADAVHFENVDGMTSTLVMEGVDPHTVWFTDRPARESGAISTMRLAEDWQPGGTFADDPPNAALVLHQATKVDDAVAETLVAEITAVGYDSQAKTFRADLRVLSAPEAATFEGNLAAHGDRHDLAWPSRAGAASLFIDSVSLAAVSSSATPSASAHSTPSASPKPSLTPSASKSAPSAQSSSPAPVVTTTFPDGTVVRRTVQPTTPFPIATLTAPNGDLVTRYETPLPPPASRGSNTTAPTTCVQSGTCTVDTSKAPTITLCSSPSTCNSSGGQNYTTNSTIYYQVSISDTATVSGPRPAAYDAPLRME